VGKLPRSILRGFYKIPTSYGVVVNINVCLAVRDGESERLTRNGVHSVIPAIPKFTPVETGAGIQSDLQQHWTPDQSLPRTRCGVRGDEVFPANRSSILVIAILLAVTLITLLSVQPGCSQPAVTPEESTEEAQDLGTSYRQEAVRRMKFNRCMSEHRGECYRKYEEAVRWCQDNWDQCFPLIKSAGISAGTYAAQVREKCRSELNARCRSEAGY
jgi:hypothetical protein